MPRRRKPTAEEVLALYRELPPDARAEGRHIILAEQGGHEQDPSTERRTLGLAA
jgi:hypothetical protein